MDQRIGLVIKSVSILTGGFLAGPGGAVIGNLTGSLLQSVLPELAGTLDGVVQSLTADLVKTTGKKILDRLQDPGQQPLNHDLQRAFRNALVEAIYDIGGETSFPAVWKTRSFTILPQVVYPRLRTVRPAGQERVGPDPMAKQAADLFLAIQQAIQSEQLFPMNGAPEAQVDIEKYIDLPTTQALADAFYCAVLEPFLTQHRSLLLELPDLERHLRLYLLDQTLIHFNEQLKNCTPAWRAYNRLVLLEIREQVARLGQGQEQVLDRLAALQEGETEPGLGHWSDALADLLSTVGRMEKGLDQKLDQVLQQAVAQHQEIVALLNQNLAGVSRIEGRLEQVVRIVTRIADGPRMVEGAPPLPIDTPPEPGDTPYQGLQVFEESDAKRFFGREVLVARITGQLCESHFLALVGASGSGKSSLARAGLIPALRRGDRLVDGTFPPTGSHNWLVRVITPTNHPLESLAAALALPNSGAEDFRRLVSDLRTDPHSLFLHARKLLVSPGWPASPGQLFLLVDQLEEVFTLCQDPEEQKTFAACLVTAGEEGKGGPIRLMIALRADFYGHCARFPGLPQLLQNHQFYIESMKPAELRSAIEQPARLGSWQIEPGLMDLILHDLGSEPGALPLLSHALLETWKRRRGRMMTLESYLETGGIHQSIAQTAETVFFHQFDEQQQAIARNLFLRLTQLGEGAEDTCRRVAFSELVTQSGDGQQVQAVIDILSSARLVVAQTGSVAVAHEALIRHWPTLRKWLDADRAGLQLHKQLARFAQDWDNHGRDPEMLYRGARLAALEEWARTHSGQMNALEQIFYEASLQRQAAELDTARQNAERAMQSNRRLRWLSAGLSTFLIAALLMAYLAVRQSSQGNNAPDQQKQQLQAEGIQRLLWESDEIATSQPDLAILLALAAQQEHATQTEQTALHARLDQDLHLLQTLNLFGSSGSYASYRISYGPIGAPLLSSKDGTLYRWDAEKHTPLPGSGTVRFDAGINDIIASPGGTQAVLLGGKGSLGVYDVPANRLRQPILQIEGALLAAAFLDETHLVAAGDSGILTYWDLLAASPAGNARPLGVKKISAFHFLPDRVTGVSGSDSGALELWDVQTGYRLGRLPDTHTVAISSLAASADGKLLAAGDENGRISVWDVPSRRLLFLPVESHYGRVNSLAFSQDGLLLVSGGVDQTVRLWRIQQPSPPAVLVLRRHAYSIAAVRFQPDSNQFTSVDVQGKAYLWSATPRLPQAVRIGQLTAPVSGLGFSASSKLLAAGDSRGETISWELPLQKPVDQQANHFGAEVTDMSFQTSIANPQLYYAFATLDQGIARTEFQGGEVDRFEQSGLRLTRLALLMDGNRAITGSEDGSLALWNLRTGIRIGSPVPAHQGAVLNLAVSPGGKFAASSGVDRQVVLWAFGGDWSVKPLQLDRWKDVMITALQFSSDGQFLYLVGWDGRIFRAEMPTNDQMPASPPIEMTLNIPARGIRAAAMDPDATELAYAGEEGIIYRYDLAANQPILPKLMGHRSPVTRLAYDLTGTLLASGSTDGEVWLWSMDRKEAEQACQLAHRNLTLVEWRNAYPDLPYRKLCPDLPVADDAFTDLLSQAQQQAEGDQPDAALASFKDAAIWGQELWDASLLNNLCWKGSTHGYASVVLNACERAVQLAPENGSYHDSRGVARAMTGDLAGAKEDFAFYLAQADAQGQNNRITRRRAEWVTKLGRGTNPFDDATLELLQDE